MQIKTLDLWTPKEYPYEGKIPTLTSYITDSTRTKPAIIICPGGGYQHVSDREAEPVALQFLAKGYQAFILRYSVNGIRHPQPLLDIAKAIKIVRDYGEEWKVDPNKVVVLGFSAGGHVAASISVHWDKDIMREKLKSDAERVKPNGTILCYPVISFQEFAHQGSVNYLLGENADEEIKEKMSLHKQVGFHTPPTFVWHTVTDASVPVENSLLYISALQKHHIPFEAHLYDKGVHGLSLAEKETSEGRKELVDAHIAPWIDLAHEWIQRNI